MPWCPKCGAEYREGFDVCDECGVKLVNKRDGDGAAAGQFEGEALLVNVNDPVQLSYITSMLDEEGIPYRIIEEGMGQYLTILFGKSYTGANIYVGKDDYEKAAEILKSYKAGTEDEQE